MNNFSRDSNGIWVTGNQNYDVKYWASSHQNNEIVEDEGSYWFTHRNNVIYYIINEFKFTDNYADIGGGNGFQILALKNRIPDPKYYLIEPGYDGCFIARKRGLDLVYNCTFQEFDFNEAGVHGFGLFDVLDHIPDDAAFLNALYSAMPPDSYLYITVPTYQFLWNDVDRWGQHQRRYDKDSLKALVDRTRFTISYFSYFFTYLVAPTFMLRTLPYRIFGARSHEEVNKAEPGLHKPNPVITSVIEFFNSGEIKRIKNKGTISYGASCILVLKK
jgi:hypothetical protein